MELGEFDIHFVPRTAIKSQALADFVAEWSEPDSTEGENVPAAEVWTLFFDGSTNLRGAGAGIVLQAPTGETF